MVRLLYNVMLMVTALVKKGTMAVNVMNANPILLVTCVINARKTTMAIRIAKVCSKSLFSF